MVAKSPSKYLRITFVLGDRDADLKAWCQTNAKACSAVLRLALREYLAGHPDAGTETPSRARGRARAVIPDTILAPPVESATPAAPPVVASPPSQPPPPPPRPSQAPDTQQKPAAAVESMKPDTQTPAPASDAKARLRKFFAANRDFA